MQADAQSAEAGDAGTNLHFDGWRERRALADEMKPLGLVLSRVSQYLKELESVGVIRRSRVGRRVNYNASPQDASSDTRQVVEALVGINAEIDMSALDAVFGALMNPFRARVIAELAKKGSASADDICEMTNHEPRYLKRDMQAAEDAGIVRAVYSEASLVAYHYIPQKDGYFKLLVALC